MVVAGQSEKTPTTPILYSVSISSSSFIPLHGGVARVDASAGQHS